MNPLNVNTLLLLVGMAGLVGNLVSLYPVKASSIAYFVRRGLQSTLILFSSHDRPYRRSVY
jgi:hypothetical protein